MPSLARLLGKRRRKIAIVVPALIDSGGVPAVARFLYDTAVRSGHYDIVLVSLASSSTDDCSVRLFGPTTWVRGVTIRHDIWEGRRFVHVGAFAVEMEFQRYRRRKALVRILADCDIVQVICGSPACALSVVGLGKPVAVQVATRAIVERRARDGASVGMLASWRRVMTLITDRMDDYALRKADAIQVENLWMLDYARGINEGRDVDIRYAPPGVDGQLFHSSDQRRPERDPYILCVGRLSDPRKNIGLLLEAFSQLPQVTREKTTLKLAGSSGPLDVFWQRAEELGLLDRVKYIERPTSEELVRLYQEASVFALPSDEEGLGIVLLEAMACGVPVVATRCGGPDGMITDGKDGYLVPLDDASTMSSRIAQLLDDAALNLAMGAKARQTIDSRYDQSVTGQVFVEIWDRMLDKTTTP